MANQPENITITRLPIRLGQFLKFANSVQDGLEAAMRIQQGEAVVNGEIETRRGRKLQADDIITFAGTTWRIVDQSGV